MGPINRIYTLNSFDPEEAKSLILSYRFKPFSYYREIDQDSLAAFLLERLRESGELIYFLIRDGSPLLGMATLESLGWDSRIFSMKMGKIDNVILDSGGQSAPLAQKLVKGVCQRARDVGLKMLACKAHVREGFLIQALESEGFRLMDTMVTYAAAMKDWPLHSSETDGTVRPIQEKDVEDLAELSETAFFDPEVFISRFHADPGLSKNGANRLYRKWFLNCVKGEQADVVLVADLGGQAVGYIACQSSPAAQEKLLGIKLGVVPLNAVRKEHRQRGIYEKLVRAALSWFKCRGHHWVEIKTQLGCLPVQRTWQKLGGKLVSAHHTFHKHF